MEIIEKKVIVAQMIEHYMRKHGYTMKELGDKLGKSEATISYWIKGRNNPKIGDIQKMADLFGVTIEEMLYGTNSANEIIPEIHVINRAARKMDQATRTKMMKILKASFEMEFDED